MGSIEEKNKAVLRRYYDEALNGRNVDVIDEVFAKTVISHGKEVIEHNDTGPYKDGTHGARAEKNLRRRQLESAPEDAIVEYDLVAEGDMVASRWSVTWAKKDGTKGGPHLHYFYRLEDGKIVEMWYMW